MHPHGVPRHVRTHTRCDTLSHGECFRGSRYAPNGSLDTLIRTYAAGTNQRFPETKVGHFLQELASALRYCHNDLHIMHRDIKPANILIDQLGTLKLADFGLSKSLGPHNNLCATYCGSPLYMSPEQCKGSNYSYPTDMWALGCVVYEIMALRSPWLETEPERCTPPVLIHKVLHATPNFAGLMQHYSTRLTQTVKWMLQKAPARRARAGQLVDMLEMRDPPIQDSMIRPAPFEPIDLADPLNTRVPLPVAAAPDKTLDRQNKLIDEARALVAAQVIQHSFRVSVEQRRNRATPIVPQQLQPLRPMDRPRVPIGKPVGPPLDNLKASAIIQNAVRVSLNRRRRNPIPARPNVPRTQPPAPRSLAIRQPCSVRIDALAQPRVRYPPANLAPRRNAPTVPLLVTKQGPIGSKPITPRQAWL